MPSRITTQEELLDLWLDEEPTERSPYAIHGNPPMWKTVELSNGMTLFTRPAKTQVRVGHKFEEVDGVSYQWMLEGKWKEQAFSTTIDQFLSIHLPEIYDDLEDDVTLVEESQFRFTG